MHTLPNRGCAARRRGSVYIAVMGVALIVSAAGISAMMVARLKLRQVTLGHDLREARLLADSAVEMGASIVMQDSSWRTSFQDSTEYPGTPMPLGNGTITWKLVDQDGNLADDETDAVRLHGIGRVGGQTYIASALLEPAGAGLTCLQAAAHAGGNALFAAATDTTGSGIISCNDTMIASGTPKLNLPMEAVNGFSGMFGPGSTTSGVSPRQMPNATHVFEYYLNNGTWIDVNDLPLWGGEPVIQDCLLSPGNNPFGAGQTNAQGIYIIDLQGANLWIQKCRIVGTLVPLNAGSVDVYTDLNWEPAVTNFPAMLVQGNLWFEIDADSTFDELAVNFNPSHTPYEGVSDSDTSDSYPVGVKGLVYATNLVQVSWGKAGIDGVLVAGGALDVDVDLDVMYRDVFLNNPPPGFRGAATTNPEQQWLDQNSGNSGNGINYTLGAGKGVGTYFAPSLPAEATSWSITRVQIYARDGGSTGTFHAQVTAADFVEKPAAVVQSVLVQETSLPGSFSWHEITFSNAGGFQPTEGACVVFVAGVNAGAQVKSGTESTGSPGTHRLTTNDGGGSWAAESSNDLWIKIWGNYTTADGSVVEISPGSWRREPGT